MRGLVIASLVIVVGTFATMLLDRYMSDAPEYIWRWMFCVVIIGGISIAVFSDPLYGYLAARAAHPIVSTVTMGLYVGICAAAIWLFLIVRFWFDVKPTSASQQLTDLVGKVAQLTTALIQSPSVEPSAQLSIAKDERARLAKRREELTPQEKRIFDTQALNLQSLEEARQQHAAIAEIEKQQQELAVREAQIREQQAAQLKDEEDKKFAIRYAPVLDYVIATLHETLSNIAKESSEPISTDFPGDRPSIYNSTFLKEGKFQKGEHVIHVGSHKEWEFRIYFREGPIYSRPLQFQIIAGPFDRAVASYPTLTVSSDGAVGTVGPAKLHVQCVVTNGGGMRSRRTLYSESCPESDYEKTILGAVQALIQDRYNAHQLGRDASPTPP